MWLLRACAPRAWSAQFLIKKVKKSKSDPVFESAAEKLLIAPLSLCPEPLKRVGACDAWMQHPTERHLADPMYASLRRWTAKTPVPTVITPEMTIAAMDEANVSIGLAAAWCGPQGWMISHDEVATLSEAYPERIIGVASADLYRPMDAVRELRRAVKELGFKAVRVVPWLWNLPPNDRRYYPLYAECIELEIPFLHTGGAHGPPAAVGDRSPNSLPRRSGA